MTMNTGRLRTSWLGKLLRELREDHGMKLGEAGEYLNRSVSVMSRMETGNMPIPAADVDALLDLYQVTDRSTRDSILRLHGTQGVTTWWDLYAEDVDEPLIDLAWLESMALCISVYSPAVVDALLQTSAYASAVATALVGKAPGHAERWVEMLAHRQTVLARPEPPTISTVIDEAVLRRPVGGRTVMGAQLRHLLALGERASIEVRVLPFAAGAHASLDGGFRVVQLPAPLTEVVSIGTGLGQLYAEPPRTQRLADTYDRLRQTALDTAASAELMAAIIDELERA